MKHNEGGDGEAAGVAGIIRELWWIFDGRVGEGVSGRFEGRKGSSLDTKFSSETNGKKRLHVKRK